MSRALRVVKAASRAARDVWDDVVAAGAARMEALTKAFAAGDVSEADYVLDMRALVKALHMGGLAVGSGGVENVTAQDLRRLGPLLRDEYRYLARKVGRMQGDERTAEQEIASVRGYAERSTSTYENAKVAKAPEHLTHARWTLHSGESCDGCAAQAARGEQLRDSFPPHGSQECGSHCKCELILTEPKG